MSGFWVVDPCYLHGLCDAETGVCKEAHNTAHGDGIFGAITVTPDDGPCTIRRYGAVAVDSGQMTVITDPTPEQKAKLKDYVKRSLALRITGLTAAVVEWAGGDLFIGRKYEHSRVGVFVLTGGPWTDPFLAGFVPGKDWVIPSEPCGGSGGMDTDTPINAAEQTQENLMTGVVWQIADRSS